MNEIIKIRWSIYDGIVKSYTQLIEKEKNSFDLGLTMLMNNTYYVKYKKSSINYDSELIIELWNLTLVAIKFENLLKLNNDFGLINSLPNNEAFQDIFKDLTKDKKINGKVLLSFIRALKALSIISVTNEVNDPAVMESIINKINLAFKIIESRFNFDLNRIPTELENEFKGKPTIILTEKTPFSKTLLLIELKKLKLIKNTQDIEIFTGIFGDKEIKPNQRVVWTGNNYSLMVFLQSIMNFTVFNKLNELYVSATRCFVKQNGISFEFKEISEARSKSNIKEAIITAINNSLPNSKQKK